ncbi:MAG: DUF4332 domain-containing protein [Promethearchaeota archaeon]
MSEIETQDAEKEQVEDVIEIEGIGKEYAEDLDKIGIKTTEDLRNASIIEIAELTGISPKLLYKWQCQADLFRVQRAAEEYTNLLFHLGIETVKELSKQKAKTLYMKVKKFAADAEKKPGWHGDVNRIPSQKDIQLWINHAKKIVKK